MARGITSSEPRSDAGRLTAVVAVFGMSLGATAFAYPLLALEAGFSAATIGLLAAGSAAAHMTAKLVLPALLGRFQDRSLMAASLAVMVSSAAALLLTQHLLGFIIAQVCQGTSRGIFHTASQTHGVRNPGLPGRRLAFVQTTAQFGRLIGPALAGAIALVSLRGSLWSAVALAGIGLPLCGRLDPRSPYRRAPKTERTPIWKRPALGVGNWGGALGGVWAGMEESFVPVILSGAGIGDAQIGLLLSIANGSGFLTTASVAKWGGPNVGSYVPLSALGIAVSLILLPFTSGFLFAVPLLVLAGSAGGVAIVLALAAAHDAVEESEQGSALALVGAYRAGARLSTPALVSGMLSVMTLSVAMVVVAVGSLVPIVRYRVPNS